MAGDLFIFFHVFKSSQFLFIDPYMAFGSSKEHSSIKIWVDGKETLYQMSPNFADSRQILRFLNSASLALVVEDFIQDCSARLHLKSLLDRHIELDVWSQLFNYFTMIIAEYIRKTFISKNSAYLHILLIFVMWISTVDRYEPPKPMFDPNHEFIWIYGGHSHYIYYQSISLSPLDTFYLWER